MKDLLIGSAFVNDSLLQRSWLLLQLAFIRATTPEEFDHVTVMSHIPESTYFQEKTIVLHPLQKFTELGGSRAHQQSLNILADYFERQRSNYRYFLLLDCDAFPIRKGWLQILLKKMEHREIAAIVRAENLELRLHAAVMLVKPEALPHLNFLGKEAGLMLDGNIEKDLNVPYYEERRHLALSLVRSNKVDVHPVACGIYFDMFYHHSNGSGCKYIEKSQGYWNHVVPPVEDLYYFTDRLMRDPNGFVHELAGWNPGEYASLSTPCLWPKADPVPDQQECHNLSSKS